jgi:hypothetical protein
MIFVNETNNSALNYENDIEEKLFDARMEERISLIRSERYFLDYERDEEKGMFRWIRMPNLTYFEAIRYLNQMMWDSLDSIGNGRGRVRYNSIRLHSEKELDETVELDDGTTCTKREKIFGSMYQNLREYDLKSDTGDRGFRPLVDDDEHHEEVINMLREIYPDGVDWDEYDQDN